MSKRNNRRKEAASKTYSAYRTFFTTEEGETVLKDLMKVAHFQSTTIGETPEATYFNEGKRNIVLQILRTAKIAPSEVNKLVDSAFNEEEDLFGLGGTGDEIH